MIQRVAVKHFKKFESMTFDLTDNIILAGPNNSGKTTLLQAIAVWNLALQKWTSLKSDAKGKKRTGIPISRKDFTAIPLRELNLLWHDRSTNLKKDELGDEGGPGAPRVITITIEGILGNEKWKLGFEFTYRSTELIYAKPTTDDMENIPKAAQDLQVVHVPPFSGIGSEETRYDRPYQNLLIGQGKAGDLIRNLLLEVWQTKEKGENRWDELTGEVEKLFKYRLLPPEYDQRPFILCEFLPGLPKGKGKNGLPALDIANAGSGFHQVLLLMGFFYARPSSVLLLDEPDAHLHVVLQKTVYDRLRSLAAAQGVQLIIATHSEVLVDGTDPEEIMSFYGLPHILQSDTERDQVREALKRVSSMEILLSEAAKGVLYVEGQSDFNLLRAWANILEHPTMKWFNENPFWYDNHGRNVREASNHFFALNAITPTIRGLLILDGDNRNIPDRELTKEGLAVGRWKRYEIESYLIHPDALDRFVRSKDMPLFGGKGMEALKESLPPVVIKDPLGKHAYLETAPVSKTILPDFFKACESQLPKAEYFRVAEQMKKNEIHPDVLEMLDRIQSALKI